MEITAETKLEALAPFLDYLKENCTDQIKEAAERKYGGVWSITLGQLFDCIDKDFRHIGADINHPEDMTVLQFFWIELFKEMLDGLMKTLEALRPPQTAEARQASEKQKPTTFREGVLLTCREYFGLHSFREAYALTIDDLLLAKKDIYNRVTFEKEITAIQSRKFKNNRK